MKTRMDKKNSTSNGNHSENSPQDHPPEIIGGIKKESDEVKSDKGQNNSYNNEKQTHHLINPPHKHSPFEWLSLIFNVLLFIVGVFYTFYAAMQWDSMKEALKKTDESIKLTQRSLELNQRQTEATEASVDIAKQSVDIARKSFIATEASFQIDQRPYLVVTNFGFPQDNPLINRHLYVNVHFANIGRSPAKNIVTYCTILIIKTNITQSERIAILDKAFQKHRPKNIEVEKSEQDNAPVADFFTTREMPFVSEEEWNAIEDDTNQIFFIGGVIYKDSFGNLHETEFCRFYFGKQPKVWHIFPSHNKIQ